MRTKIMSVILVLFITVVLGLAGCGGGGGSVSDGNVPNNKVTAANAGSSQNVSVSSLVILDGSQSTGADGKLITYNWSFTSKPAGSAATLSSPTIVNPTFSADVAGTYIVSLVVNDGTVNSEPSTVTITASQTNSAPVAKAGPAQNVLEGTVVVLDGSGSTDANKDTLTYKWAFTSKPAGSAATLSSPTIVNPTFSADVAGTYVVSLVVNDGKVDSNVSTVIINVSLSNTAPVANAGTGLNVRTGRPLTLDGSASSDADGNALSYAWSFTSKPAGSSAVLSDATSIHPTFTPDVDGSYVINLVVNDGKIDSAPSAVTIKSVTDLRLLFPVIIATAGTSTDGYVQPGSSFSSNIKNISNETFILSKYEITNNGIPVSSTTDPLLLNNNRLAPGESVSVRYTIATLPVQDLGFAANYYFTDPVTKTDFAVNRPYPTFATGTYQY